MTKSEFSTADSIITPKLRAKKEQIDYLIVRFDGGMPLTREGPHATGAERCTE